MQLIDVQSQLDQYADKEIHLEVLGEIKSGKEATVYKVIDQDDGELLALKVYKSHQMRAFKQNYQYLAGFHIQSRTMRQAVRKKTALGRQYIQDTWVNREYSLLTQLNEAGADVPEVYAHSQNSILFQYLGADQPAPRIKEVTLTVAQARVVFDGLIENVCLFLRCGFVHGDLSAFNILWWEHKAYIIDFPQAVDIKKNPNAHAILDKDIRNLISHFRKYLEIDEAEVMRRVEPHREMMIT